MLGRLSVRRERKRRSASQSRPSLTRNGAPGFPRPATEPRLKQDGIIHCLDDIEGRCHSGVYPTPASARTAARWAMWSCSVGAGGFRLLALSPNAERMRFAVPVNRMS